MQARVDACFPVNVSWSDAMAPCAVMYFQSKGLVQHSECPNSEIEVKRNTCFYFLEMFFIRSLATPSKAGQ